MGEGAGVTCSAASCFKEGKLEVTPLFPTALLKVVFFLAGATIVSISVFNREERECDGGETLEFCASLGTDD